MFESWRESVLSRRSLRLISLAALVPIDLRQQASSELQDGAFEVRRRECACYAYTAPRSRSRFRSSRPRAPRRRRAPGVPQTGPRSQASGRPAPGAGVPGTDCDAQFTIAPARPVAGARRGAAKRPAPSLALAVDVGPSENAVVLVEQDGEYTWHYPPASGPRAAPRAGRGEAFRAQPGRHPGHARTRTISRRQRRTTRCVQGCVLGRARAIVLKFIARQRRALA